MQKLTHTYVLRIYTMYIYIYIFVENIKQGN